MAGKEVAEKTDDLEGPLGGLFHAAAKDGDVDLMEKLLGDRVQGDSKTRSFHPDDRDKYLMTPLHYAVWYDRERVVQLLFRHGANPDLKNRNGLSALHIACTNAIPGAGMVRLLLDWGANPRILDKNRIELHNYAVCDSELEDLLTAAAAKGVLCVWVVLFRSYA